MEAILADGWKTTPADAERVLSPLIRAGGWLVLSRDWEDDPSGELATRAS
jgi:hypothetical protein